MVNLSFLNDQQVYAGKWEKVESSLLKDANKDFYNNIEKAVVKIEEQSNKTTGEVFTGRSICCFLKSGGQVYLKLSPLSKLEHGDKVDVSTIEAVQLHRDGEDDIVKFDACKA